ncbi:hypothetical protein GCM10009079_08740 [Ralstonia mannitolilytica]
MDKLSPMGMGVAAKQIELPVVSLLHRLCSLTRKNNRHSNMPKRIKTSSQIFRDQHAQGQALFSEAVDLIRSGAVLDIGDVLTVGTHFGHAVKRLPKEIREATITGLLNKANDLRNESGGALAMLLIGAVVTEWTTPDPTPQMPHVA